MITVLQLKPKWTLPPVPGILMACGRCQQGYETEASSVEGKRDQERRQEEKREHVSDCRQAILFF
jgi:hypothetical protein